ncbi:type II toxin-antitoxin system PemK/MazF family toxin [Nonomuraea sp. NPDC050394]|uniref:type II toxin-antitoxin system PemK/MazF family toxin n=1 Tax=Nonomuraea sp. NPDC050394 TaxID=3364363 RepID=UPI003787D462
MSKSAFHPAGGVLDCLLVMVSCLSWATGSPGAAEGVVDLLLVLGCVVGFFALIAWLGVWVAGRRPVVHERPPDSSWNSRPAPGQIWWAAVPFADGSGSKVRPCLVVRTHGAGVEVLKITSQDKSHRHDCVPIPTRPWDKRARKDSWIDLSGTHFLHDQAFHRIAGPCDTASWQGVRRQHRTGWVYAPKPR